MVKGSQVTRLSPALTTIGAVITLAMIAIAGMQAKHPDHNNRDVLIFSITTTYSPTEVNTTIIGDFTTHHSYPRQITVLRRKLTTTFTDVAEYNPEALGHFQVSAQITRRASLLGRAIVDVATCQLFYPGAKKPFREDHIETEGKIGTKSTVRCSFNSPLDAPH